MTEYVHGWDKEEQLRLKNQAVILEDTLMKDLPFHKSKKCLEFGCGVGAQTKLLLRRFQNIEIVGVDVSQTQLDQAREHLHGESRVTLLQTNGQVLPFSEGTFDSAYVCWVLEHLKEPEKALAEIFRCLAPEGVVVLTEVFNATLQLWPPPPDLFAERWKTLNDRQKLIGCDPNVGRRLSELCVSAGFRIEEIKAQPLVATQGVGLEGVCSYWVDLISSGQGLLPEEKDQLKLELQKEMELWQQNPGAFFFYTPIRVVAVKQA